MNLSSGNAHWHAFYPCLTPSSCHCMWRQQLVGLSRYICGWWMSVCQIQCHSANHACHWQQWNSKDTLVLGYIDNVHICALVRICCMLCMFPPCPEGENSCSQTHWQRIKLHRCRLSLLWELEWVSVSHWLDRQQRSRPQLLTSVEVSESRELSFLLILKSSTQVAIISDCATVDSVNKRVWRLNCCQCKPDWCVVHSERCNSIRNGAWSIWKHASSCGCEGYRVNWQLYWQWRVCLILWWQFLCSQKPTWGGEEIHKGTMFANKYKIVDAINAHNFIFHLHTC